MRGRVLRSPALLAFALALALAGCIGSSRPSRFYTLTPSAAGQAPTTAGADAILAVGPVEIPDYVDRHQIVTRAGTNEIVLAEFDRWAGSLRDEITRSLVAVLADRLSPQHIAVSTGRPPDAVPGASTYRAAVSISRFDGVPGQSVVLRGRWALIAQRDGKARAVAVREATVTEKVDGAGYEALVAAMSRALARFGEELADSVTAQAHLAKAP